MSDITFKHSFFSYPQSLKDLVSDGRVDFGVWYLMNDDETVRRFQGLQKRYPGRRLYPFARRDNNDDVACFEDDDNSLVHIIYDFADIGWEQKEVFSTIYAWLEYIGDDNLQDRR